MALQSLLLPPGSFSRWRTAGLSPDPLLKFSRSAGDAMKTWFTPPIAVPILIAVLIAIAYFIRT